MAYFDGGNLFVTYVYFGPQSYVVGDGLDPEILTFWVLRHDRPSYI